MACHFQDRKVLLAESRDRVAIGFRHDYIDHNFARSASVDWRLRNIVYGGGRCGGCRGGRIIGGDRCGTLGMRGLRRRVVTATSIGLGRLHPL